MRFQRLKSSPSQSYLCYSIEFFWTMSNSDLSVAVPSWWDCRTSRTPAGTWTATTESEYCQKWSNSQWGGTFEARHGWPHWSVILDHDHDRFVCFFGEFRSPLTLKQSVTEEADVSLLWATKTFRFVVDMYDLKNGLLFFVQIYTMLLCSVQLYRLLSFNIADIEI